MTSSIQELFGTDEPALGMMPPQHVVDSGSTLSAAAGVEEILDARLVAPGFEMPGSRYTGWYPPPRTGRSPI
ncbi:hypothetical protein [Dactylosporangium sp. NPDC051484]|uniref:hypothetical protein n=1 Tax=Dactylosporangium sp. NPDC051484 TaxID=3154942 RepID=UPI00344BC244